MASHSRLLCGCVVSQTCSNTLSRIPAADCNTCARTQTHTNAYPCLAAAAVLIIAGCSKLQITLSSRVSSTTWCLEAPSDSDISSMPWQNLKLFHRTPCVPGLKQQCFQIDEPLTEGSRIMYQGLCVGLQSSPLPGAPTLSTDAVRLTPCGEGYVKWKQATPGGYITVTQTGCSGSYPPRECSLGLVMASVTGAAQIIDIRPGAKTLSANWLPSRASYSVVQESPGE